MVLSSCVQLLFITGFLILIYKKKDIIKWGTVLLVLDFFITIQLVGSFTVFTKEISGTEIHQTFKSREKEVPQINC